MGEVLNRSYVSDEALQGKSASDQIKSILYFKAPFVAVVDPDRRFEKLIDRQRLADEVARSVMLE